MGARHAFAFAAVVLVSTGTYAAKPTPLFADDAPIRIGLRGPLSAIARTPSPARTARPATLTLISPKPETHAVMLSPRGMARRVKESCSFPPLRVEFTAKPPATSLFEHQHRLKLTTYCRTPAGHQGYILLEYAAYRMFNLLSPTGLRARLVNVDYSEADGGGAISRVGFFVEDPGDAAKRNNLVEVKTTARLSPTQLDPMAAARGALFEYMVGNHDWSMRASHAGETCCHNFKLMAKTANAQSGLIPVPYDYDYSGFVNTPYAVPPEELRVSSVRDRMYRGYCIHNAQALAAAAEFRAKRGEMLGVLASIPGIDEGKRRGAAAYLDKFFSEIATDADVTKRVLRTCIN